MRNSDRYLAGAVLMLLFGVYVCAQTANPTEGGASDPDAIFETASGARYATLLMQDQIVFNSAASTADDFRLVINRYWSFVRRYPSNGYTDNALWQAANLSAESFRRFEEQRDRNRALQLLHWLTEQYPHSSLSKIASVKLAELEAVAPAAPETPPPAPAATTVAAPVSTAAPAATSTTSIGTIRGIQREVLPDVVRVTVELDREVSFYQERIEGPARLFFDLRGTKTVPALVDSTFRYNSDVVRHIRMGRHPNSTTRIVLDLENVRHYSVFTLYNPYRIVIDAERAEHLGPRLIASKALTGAGTPIPLIRPRAAIAPNTPVASSASRRVGLPVAASRPIALTAAVAPLAPLPRPAPIALNAPIASNALSAPAPSATISPIAPIAPKAPDAVDAETPGTIAVEKPAAVRKPVAPATNSSGKFSVSRQLGLGVSRIVIDAGHGGHDPGASAHGISEAELVLDIALRLETLLAEQAGMDVVLTRRTNAFISLDERTEIANRESADLFLSIHANASANVAARGVETYFLNFALNPQAEAVAARENATSGKTMNSLPEIVKAITLNNKLNESRDFASSIQRALIRGMRPGNKVLRDLGVKQAPFMVLIGAAMPSVLAEISFVTNRQEARLLKTPAYRQRIAESLLAGVLRYQDSLKKVQTAALQ